jgi:type IV pilus assembly protein PilA
MLARLRKAQENGEGGFTLIELLVVIIIIGILAAIAIPTFLNQRAKGWDAASKSELKNLATALESYATDNGGSYADATVAGMAAEGYNQSADFTEAEGGTATIATTESASGVADGAYCIQVSHASQPDVFWSLSSEGAGAGSPVEAECA